MTQVLWRFFADRKNSLVGYIIASSAFVFMYIALFPSIKEQAEKFTELFNAYPEGLLAALGVESIGFNTIESFMQLEYYSLIVPLFLILLMLPLAAGAISGEIERGTIENVLARPVSRMSLYFSRFFSGVLSLLVFVVVTNGIILPSVALFRIETNPRAFFYVALLSFLFGLAVLCLGMMFSAIFSERSKVYMSAGGTLFLMYVLFVVAQLKDDLKWLGNVSLFKYFDHKAALLDVSFPGFSALIFLLFSVVVLIIGALWFKKRDVSI